jgi:hypothetical protein
VLEEEKRNKNTPGYRSIRITGNGMWRRRTKQKFELARKKDENLVEFGKNYGHYCRER